MVVGSLELVVELGVEWITAEYAETAIMDRRREAHKGDFGKILVVAGSVGMVGAAILCGKAAYRAGAGLVRVAIDESLFPIIQIALPEATCVPRQIFSGYDVIAAGPGLGDNPENEELICRLLRECDKTVVLDADGLNALAKAGKAGALKDTAAKVVITPHMGEAKRLIPKSRLEKDWPTETVSDESRLKIAEMLMEETGATVVLKGAGTIVADQEHGAFVNTTGNPGMATGGSGDVLAGIIAAFAGQGASPWDSAKAGVFIHGLAGDMAADAFGEHGMTAMDIVDMTPHAIKGIRDRRRRG
ncbi:MAG: NAD(P)H-hydrate dehydratase [Clostridiales bacterium]|nr:NAD(P)H-hydrate dehydratase [Clostridiales bacterium]